MQFHLFLPQMRMSFEQIIARARAAEAAGFGGIAGMDHLAPPLAEHTPMYSSMVTNTWIAAHTERLSISSLVLCDSFRLPAVLANEAVSIDNASGGRYELGIGWGSVPTEFTIYGVGSTEPRQRVARLRESLEVMTRLWAGETIDFEGEFHQLKGARQAALPLRKIPIVIGGTGPKTLALVRDYADWWNVHVGAIDRVQELRPQVGDAKASIQQMVAYIPNEASREEITSLATKRFGRSKPIIGSGPELVEHYTRLQEQGIERVYAWFCDFAEPESLAGFGAEVIGQMG
ncbi:MAG TPA: LLM class flavin-dependent oxidoreductase [Frankiaceae bacterium]|jgi:alkanesulfonate monooxygenase SsuD/methylene tetrahydromethanopterin reductase-like flavin-dependent oxidoreductase (luciferase family)|nr:LLM class flavin-dependent oxidoreductase [Frankiaceae bacterium]